MNDKVESVSLSEFLEQLSKKSKASAKPEVKAQEDQSGCDGCSGCDEDEVNEADLAASQLLDAGMQEADGGHEIAMTLLLFIMGMAKDQDMPETAEVAFRYWLNN